MKTPIYSLVKNSLFILTLISLIIQNSFAQESDSIKNTNKSQADKRIDNSSVLTKLINSKSYYLDKETIGKLIYLRFSNITTGGITGNSLVNYASVETINGSWNLNGAIPIGRSGKEQSKISVLNLKVGGEVLAGNTITLFSNSKLNAGSYADLQYNIGFKNSARNITYYSSDTLKYHLKKERIIYDYKKDTLEGFLDSLTLVELIHSLELKSIEKNLKIDSLNRIIKEKEPLLHHADSIKARNDITKSMTGIKLLQQDLLKLRYQIDSLSFVKSRWRTFNRSVIIESINNKLDLAVAELNLNAKIYTANFVWFSINVGMGRKKFYTYNWANPFPTQIDKRHLETFKIGTSVHWYKEFNVQHQHGEDKLFRFYSNLGVSMYKDNNTDNLETIDITEDHSYKNPTGDTVRKTSEKFKGYADSSILTSTVFNSYINLYLTLPSKFITFHLFPSVDSYFKRRTMINIGAGCIFSFMPQKKESPILNAELFVRFDDILEKTSVRNNGNYNTVGIKIAHPINFSRN